MPDQLLSIKKLIEARGSLAGALTLEASASTPAVAAVLAGGPLPPGSIKLGAVSLRGEAGKSVRLGSGRGAAEFKASAGAHGRFGIYANALDVREALALDEHGFAGLDLVEVSEHRFGVLDWGYEAAVGGGIALHGSAAVGIEGEGRRTARFAVVRLLPDSLGGKAFIGRTLSSWVLPRQVESVDDLTPGTWVVAEVDGSVGVRVSARHGLAIDWVKEAQLGGLEGDVGLKIDAGVEVALGFSSAGRYHIVVSRPSMSARDKTIRVQLFKARRKGWDFALNAGATVESVAGLLPSSFDAFMAGVLGVDGNQLLSDLKSTVRAASDPGPALQLLLGESPGVDALLTRLTPGAADVVARYRQAWSRIDGLLKAWDRLDHRVAAFLWGSLGNGQAVADVRSFAGEVAGLEPDAVRSRIRERIEGVVEGGDAILQWITAVLGTDLLAAVTESKTADRVRKAAARTARILDPEALGGVLEAVHDYASDRLSIDRLKEAVQAGSPESLDNWLVTRMESFLGRAIDAAGVAQLGAVIDRLEAKGPELFDAARAALTKQYQASFALAYQRSTSRTALIDLDIDGAHPDAARLLKRSISGDLGRLLLEPHEAVRLRTGALTHGVERNAHVSVSLPFFERDIETMTRSLARVEAADKPGGRVTLYALDAENVVTKDNRMRSRLALAGTIPASGDQVRRWSEPEWSSTYEYARAFPGAARAVLEHQLEPLVETYVPDAFPLSSDGRSRLTTWLDDWDRTITKISGNPSGDFGNIVIRVSAALPARLGAAWTKAPRQRSAPEYRQMSLNMQAAMRTVMLRVADAKPNFFGKRVEASSLLLYASLPPAHGASILRGGGVNLRTQRAIHWNWRDPKLLKAIVQHHETMLALPLRFEEVHRRLTNSADASERRKASKFAPTREVIMQGIGIALQDRAGGALNDLQRLLFVEEAAIEAARESGQAMAKFREASNRDAEAAVAALAAFGEKTTRAFNEKLSRRFGDVALPALSGELFAAAAKAFDPAAAKLTSQAILEVTCLRDGADMTDLSAPPPAGDVLVAQRFVRG